MLQVTVAEQHDQTLVDARMLGVQSSPESRRTTEKSEPISPDRDSDYYLQRVMASLAKIGTFLQRRLPRAQTDMAAHTPGAPVQRSDTN